MSRRARKPSPRGAERVRGEHVEAPSLLAATGGLALGPLSMAATVAWFVVGALAALVLALVGGAS